MNNTNQSARRRLMPILLSVPEFGKCVICLDARKWMLPLP